jgi:hypothetical protein
LGKRLGTLFTAAFITLFGAPIFTSASSQDNSNIVLSIMQLDNRVIAGKNSSSGILKLKFANRASHEVSLQFAGSLSNGGWDVLTKRGLVPVPSYYYNSSNGGYRSYGASVSSLTYEWTSQAGPAVVGNYDVSQPAKTLKTNESISIYVPIQLPSSPGSYQLNVHFDSSPMVDIMHSRGSSMSPESFYGCFEADAHATIEIPSKSSEPASPAPMSRTFKIHRQHQ